MRIDHTAVLPAYTARRAATDFVRPSSVDLPSLAESVRSVEERIARQNAEFEALTGRAHRIFAGDTEAAAVARANALAVGPGGGARRAGDRANARRGNWTGR